MNITQRWIIGVGAVVLLGLAVYVPWTGRCFVGQDMETVTPLVYRPIWSPPQVKHPDCSVVIDLPATLLPMGGVTVVAAAAFLLAGSPRGPRGQFPADPDAFCELRRR